MHDILHTSKLKPAVGFVPGSSRVILSAFRPPAGNSGEFEVEHILYSHFVHRGHSLVKEFLVKWCEYDLFEAPWEPLAKLTNCPDVFSSFH